jgi:hypothetical protein
LLWVNDWYDAPLEAVVEYLGERCLLRLEDHAALDAEQPVRWLLYPLDAHQLAEHERWHDDYVTHVGTHWCFHDEAHVEDGNTAAHPEGFFQRCRNRAPVDVAALEARGWLDALPLR